MADLWSKQIPRTLVESFEKGQPPVVFIGSGLGREAIPPLKTAGDLGAAASARLGITPDSESLADQLQYLKNDARSARFVIDWLQKALLHGSAKPGGAHHLLLHLPISEYLTTNYDSLLNDAALGVRDFRLLDIYDPGSYNRPVAHAIRTAVLGRMHGSFSDARSIVATTDDYIDNFEHGTRWRELLTTLLRERTVIFVGYSLRDFTTWTSFIATRLRWAREMPPHFLVAPAPPHVTQYWSGYGITHIPLTAHAFLIGLHERLGSFPANADTSAAAAAACKAVAMTEITDVLERVRLAEHYADITYAAVKIVSEAQR
jgi:hypothetical protein